MRGSLIGAATEIAAEDEDETNVHRRAEVERYGPTKGRPVCQKIIRASIPSCIAATHSSDECRERMEKSLMARRTSRIDTSTEYDSMGQTLLQDDPRTDDNVRDERKNQAPETTINDNTRHVRSRRRQHVLGLREWRRVERARSAQGQASGGGVPQQNARFRAEHYVKLRSPTWAVIPSRFDV